MRARASAPNELPEPATSSVGRRRDGVWLPSVRIGLAGGLAAMLCCVGPTLLAIIGVATAATAYTWAETLYGTFAWAFRGFGLIVIITLVVVSLRRRRQCTLAGVHAARRSLLVAVVVAGATYALLYGVTTWLGDRAIH